jgi:hypothetical protein
MTQSSLTCCAAILCGVILPLSASQAQNVPTRTLDYVRTVARGTMIYIPYQGLGSRGPVYFTQYKEELSATATVLDLRRIFVNLTPIAFKDGSYSAFVNERGIIDDKVLPVPSAGRCQATDAIQELLRGMPNEYRPSIQPGNYPFACTLSVWFLPDDEALVRRTIETSHGIAMSANVPLCAPDSPQVNSPEIVRRLITDGVVQRTGAGNATGNTYDMLYATVMMARNNPSLFGTSDPRVGWDALMANVSTDFAAMTSTIPSHTVNNTVYVCSPRPLAVSY